MNCEKNPYVIEMIGCILNKFLICEHVPLDRPWLGYDRPGTTGIFVGVVDTCSGLGYPRYSRCIDGFRLIMGILTIVDRGFLPENQS